jgi:hypothetical protein
MATVRRAAKLIPESGYEPSHSGKVKRRCTFVVLLTLADHLCLLEGSR